MPTTVTIPFNLADDTQAQAFYVATAAEGTFNALVAFYQHALERRDNRAGGAPDPSVHEIRKQFRGELVKNSVGWILASDADTAGPFRRSAVVAELTFELGFPAKAFAHAHDLFVAARAIYTTLDQSGYTVRWALVVDTILAKLQPEALAAAFRDELEARGIV